MVVGIARSGFSPGLTPGLSYGGAVELGYQIRMDQALTPQPTWVWILRPGGAGALPGIAALGLPISWGF